MRINEIFGPTIQGEGPAMGRHALFVRLFGCNLECTWCDTPYTWATTPQKAEKHHLRIEETSAASSYPDGRVIPARTELIPKVWDETKESIIMTAEDVYGQLEKLWPMSLPTIIVFSGGEPLMQQGDEELQSLMRTLATRHQIHIETAGTIHPNSFMSEWINQWVCSPKLENSGNIKKKRYKPETLTDLRDLDADFKFVVKNRTDLFEVDDIVSMHDLARNKVWIMPEGVTRAELNKVSLEIVEDVTLRGYNLGQRLHINIWGDKRGV